MISCRMLLLEVAGGTVKRFEIGKPMSGTGNDDVDEYVEDFHKHRSEIDKLGQIVLNAHAEVEATLNYFFEEALPHPEYFEDNRVSFADRVQLARALTPETPEHPEWRVIIALNAVRNEVAHSGNEKKRAAKIARLREEMLAPVRPKLHADIKKRTKKSSSLTRRLWAAAIFFMREMKSGRRAGCRRRVSDDGLLDQMNCGSGAGRLLMRYACRFPAMGDKLSPNKA